TLAKIQQVRPGFEPQRLLTFEIELPGSRYGDDNARRNFVKEWEAKVSALPGVESVGAVSHLPLDDYSNWYSPYRPEGVPEKQASSLLADNRSVTPGYLRTMGTRPVEGRQVAALDRADVHRLAIGDAMLAHAA